MLPLSVQKSYTKPEPDESAMKLDKYSTFQPDPAPLTFHFLV